jgi:hypothetical protein
LSGSVSSELLIKILSSLEDVRQTLKWHSTMLQATLHHISQNADGVACETPEGMAFPLKTFEDVGTFEQKLADSSTKNMLVGFAACLFEQNII